jgi:hypothetical protein
MSVRFTPLARPPAWAPRERPSTTSGDCHEFGPSIEAFADYVDALDRARARDSAHTVADSPMLDGQIPCPR